MEDRWRSVPLSEVTHRITKGTTPTTVRGSFCSSGISFVKVESITANGRIDVSRLAYIDTETDAILSRSRLQHDDILFTIAGTIGRVSLVDSAIIPGNTNQAVAIIRPDQSKIEPRFLYFALRDSSRINEAKTRVVQSVQANFSLSELSRLNVPLPSLKEQREIVSILGALDDKIDLNRKMSATLEAMARALFKSWFVDYDPVRAKLEARSTGLSSAIADLFPDSFENSERGDIPNGWCLSRLSTISASIQRGVSPIYTDAGILVINQKCIRDGHIDLSKARRHDSLTKSVKGRIAQRGDVLVNSTGVGTLGRVAPVVALHAVEATVDSHVTMVRPDPTAVNPTYLGSAMLHLQPEIETMGEGSTGQTELSRVRLGGLIIVTSPRSIQERFAYLVEPLSLKVAANGQESGTLSALRNALLPKLISGELRVSEAERILEVSA